MSYNKNAVKGYTVESLRKVSRMSKRDILSDLRTGTVYLPDADKWSKQELEWIWLEQFGEHNA